MPMKILRPYSPQNLRWRGVSSAYPPPPKNILTNHQSLFSWLDPLVQAVAPVDTDHDVAEKWLSLRKTQYSIPSMLTLFAQWLKLRVDHEDNPAAAPVLDQIEPFLPEAIAQLYALDRHRHSALAYMEEWGTDAHTPLIRNAWTLSSDRARESESEQQTCYWQGFRSAALNALFAITNKPPAPQAQAYIKTISPEIESFLQSFKTPYFSQSGERAKLIGRMALYQASQRLLPFSL